MTDEFLSAIGSVTVNFAILEMYVEFVTWSLLVGGEGDDLPAGRIVTAELSFRKSVDLLAALHRHRFPDDREAKLKALRKKLFAVEAERNLVIHSWWLSSEENKFLRTKSTAKGVFKTKSEHLTVDDIRAIAERIYDAAEQVFNLHLVIILPAGDEPKAP